MSTTPNERVVETAAKSLDDDDVVLEMIRACVRTKTSAIPAAKMNPSSVLRKGTKTSSWTRKSSTTSARTRSRRRSFFLVAKKNNTTGDFREHENASRGEQEVFTPGFEKDEQARFVFRETVSEGFR